ncbi:hypothetical protein BCIN_03g04040 [Botrytis cinerea B05.10]|uniref:Uncharacterized protein n=1 Tax=Botryotinia fuckeliana (strain B05.10) TaxID=332648 RepID=A0A384JBZ6_BOTFB|nr:hypothetical protein BCIN_03g04040 [Botrytis cinerea B05.10]ATZ48158.1 hypothetical protein BCIN_03g04040 [Botrytis cinerea B05.10]
MSNNTVETTPLQGWTNSPDYRGTMDIVFSCTFTISICICSYWQDCVFSDPIFYCF